MGFLLTWGSVSLIHIRFPPWRLKCTTDNFLVQTTLRRKCFQCHFSKVTCYNTTFLLFVFFENCFFLVLQVSSFPRILSSFLIFLELITILQSGLSRTASNQVPLHIWVQPSSFHSEPSSNKVLPLLLSLSVLVRALSGRWRRLHPCPCAFWRGSEALPGGVCCQNGALSFHGLPVERFPVHPPWEQRLPSWPQRDCHCRSQNQALQSHSSSETCNRSLTHHSACVFFCIFLFTSVVIKRSFSGLVFSLKEKTQDWCGDQQQFLMLYYILNIYLIFSESVCL